MALERVYGIWYAECSCGATITSNFLEGKDDFISKITKIGWDVGEDVKCQKCKEKGE